MMNLGVHQNITEFPIELLNLPAYVFNILRDNEKGIIEIGQLIEKSEIELLEMKGIGKMAIAYIKNSLFMHKLILKGDDPI